MDCDQRSIVEQSDRIRFSLMMWPNVFTIPQSYLSYTISVEYKYQLDKSPREINPKIEAIPTLLLLLDTHYQFILKWSISL